ncbi:MAG: LuxR family transcriptional regulator [Frankiales bacterium]|nr:LuxR family transcriptional regulator [Frankiales bacterium]
MTDGATTAYGRHEANGPLTSGKVVAAVDQAVAASGVLRRRASSYRCTLGGTGDAALLDALVAVRTCLVAGDVDDDLLRARARLAQELAAVDAHDAEVRAAVRDGIRSALEELREAPTTWTLVEQAVRAVCEACGFTRSLVSAVRNARWVPLVVHTREDLDPKAATFRTFVSSTAPIPLVTMLGETEMVRRRTALRFVNPLEDRRTFKPIIVAAGSPGYAAAPVVVGHRTLGFVHVDRVGQDLVMTEDDRVAVGSFAGGLGWLFDRTASQVSLHTRAQELERAMGRARVALTLGLDQEGEPPAEEAGPDDERTTSDAVAAHSRTRLTAREREVLDLVAQGATDRGAAERLTLSEETVRSHLRSVRRKLQVSSRGAAVARYRALQDLP